MIEDCYNCKHANQYLLPYWYPHFAPTCLKGHCMNCEDTCEDFELIGRLSR